MDTRLRTLVGLLLGVITATFLLSRMNRLIYGPPPSTLLALQNSATRLILQFPDEHIALPLLSVRVSQIRDTWQARRSGRRRHEGQDIFAPIGTPVYSATNGILIQKGDAGKGGNAVSVLGAGGRVYYYAHLAGFAQSLCVGDKVTSETLIGFVGTTGNARGTPAHLHFGVYGFTGAMNPLPLLTNRPRTAAPDANL